MVAGDQLSIHYDEVRVGVKFQPLEQLVNQLYPLDLHIPPLRVSNVNPHDKNDNPPTKMRGGETHFRTVPAEEPPTLTVSD